MKEFGVTEVASYEGDPLCIGARYTPRASHVFRFALSVDSELRARFVATRFEDLLQGATELDHFRASGRLGPEAIEEFLRTIDAYIPDLALREWKIFADEALQLP